MKSDLLWLSSLASITTGIALMHVPSALIFLGICLGVIAYFGRQERR